MTGRQPHLGLFFFYTDAAAPLTELARAAEDAGVESIWVPEHSHVPVETTTKPPLGERTPEKYARLYDPLVVLSSLAAVTSRVKLGTAVSLIAHHDPIILAKQLASLDQLSGGRLILGIGAGWNRAEIENHGVDFDARWPRAIENLRAMKEIWTQDIASFTGPHVSFDRIQSWPKPRNKRHIPVLLGNLNPTPMVARHGEGWLPLSMAHPAGLPGQIETLRKRVREAGRDDADLDVTVMCLERTSAATVGDYFAAGATRVVLRAPLSDTGKLREFVSGYESVAVRSA